MPTDLSFGKLVATPTPQKWAQAYNAGSLFAVLSLEKREEESEQNLPALGKSILNNTEAEFFTLEEKSLATIKQAIDAVCSPLPSGVNLSFCLAFFKDPILYLFLRGKGQIIIKRGEQIGVLLHAEQERKEALTASGILKPGDRIMLETEQFQKAIPQKDVNDALSQETTDEVTEALLPKLHGQEGGAGAALVLHHSGTDASHTPLKEQEEYEEKPIPHPQRKITPAEESNQDEQPIRTRNHPGISFFAVFSRLSPTTLLHSHQKRVFFSIAAILLVVLIGSIIVTNIKKGSEEQTKIFRDIYPTAQKQYDEAKGLLELNQALAKNDLEKARKTLEEGLTKLKKGSEEEKKVHELLAKINTDLSSFAKRKEVEVKEVSDEKSSLLAQEKTHKDALSATEDEKNVYVLTEKEVLAIEKGSEKEESIIKQEEDNDWSDAVGISTFFGNIYILDTGKGVVKYVSTSDGFSKMSYFAKDTNPPPDLSKAVSMAIDSSVYILMRDGTIMKFTRGTGDSFNVSALDEPFRSPGRIFTNKDIDNIYILDRGNGRIVKLNKSGAFQAQYAASILGSAKDFIVTQDEKKVIILSDNKLYEISL